MKRTNRAASLILALLLCLSLLPCGALASEEPEELPADAEVIVGEEGASDEPETADADADVPETEVLEAEPSEDPVPEEAPPASEPEEVPSPSIDGTSLPDSLYLNQDQSGWCTLASCAMMLRARYYLSGYDGWSSITQQSIYSSAWLPGSGVYFNWSYSLGGNRVTVSHARINGLSVNALKSILDAHPEGIALYLYDYPHAIFVSDYEGNTFYGADPARGYTAKRQPIGETWLGKTYGGQASLLSRADAYWYVSSYRISSTTSYTLTFDANGGSCSESSRTVKGGYAVGELPVPTRRGWVFSGWYTGQYDGKLVTKDSTVASNTTLYAHWYAVSGSITFSESPATIRLYEGRDTASVTVSGTGYINGITLDYSLEAAAAGKLSAAWSGSGDGNSRTIVFTADPSASGAYHATFSMYDADTGRLINEQSLTINVISEDLYISIYQTDIVFASGTADETVDIFYGGTDGDLPEGYAVSCSVENPLGTTEAVSCELQPFNGYCRPLVIRSRAAVPCEVPITVRLTDPSGGICSETVIHVHVYDTSGVCGGEYEGNVQWTFENGQLRISIMDPASDEGGDMWNYETEFGRAPWTPWANEILGVEIEAGVTRIGSCAFYGCSALRYVTIADTVLEIGEKAFWNCAALTSLSVPGSVTFVAADAFHGCSELAELTFHEGTSRLSPGALDGCAALATLYVPASMTDMQVSADTAVRDLYFDGTRAEWEQLDTACAVTEKLPANAVIHIRDDQSVSDAARLLSDGSAFDAAVLLRSLVGLAGAVAAEDGL